MAELRTVDLNTSYLASVAGGPHVNMTTAIGGIHFDGAGLAAGVAGSGGPDYMRITRGATDVLSTSYNATDDRGWVHSDAVNGLDIGPNPVLDRTTITVMLDRLRFLRQDRTFAVGPSSGFFTWDSAITVTGGGSIGGFVSLDGSVIFDTVDASGFGMGNALRAGFNWIGLNGANLGPGFVFAGNNTFTADGGVTSISQTRIYFDNAVYNTANGGTLNSGISTIGHVSFWAGMQMPDASVTIVQRRGLFVPEVGPGLLGTLTTQGAVDIDDLSHAATNFGIRSTMSAGAGKLVFDLQGTAQANFGGVVGLGLGATVDWEISRVAANLASLADGDSLRITTGSLFMGPAGDVALSRGAADRLDLASGDDFRLLSGALQFAGTAEQISASAGELLLTAAVTRTTAELDIGGALNHDGTTIGFYGAAPVVQSAAYTPTNVSADRAYDADATSTSELADVLGTLIADLQATGIIG
jgi:hypothetical protein